MLTLWRDHSALKAISCLSISNLAIRLKNHKSSPLPQEFFYKLAQASQKYWNFQTKAFIPALPACLLLIPYSISPNLYLAAIIITLILYNHKETQWKNWVKSLKWKVAQLWFATSIEYHMLNRKLLNLGISILKNLILKEGLWTQEMPAIY